MLITGAGPIGAMAVAVAKVSGAAQVIVSEIKEFRKELARKMGADVIIDPTKEDLTKKVKAMTEDNGPMFCWKCRETLLPLSKVWIVLPMELSSLFWGSFPVNFRST